MKAGKLWNNLKYDESTQIDISSLKLINRLSKEKTQEILTALKGFEGSKIELAEKLGVPYYQVYSVFYRKFNPKC